MAKPSPLSPTTRKLLQQERRNISKQSKQARQDRLDAATREWRNRRDSVAKSQSRTSQAVSDALLVTLKQLVTTVGSTWRVNVPVHLSRQSALSAFTDFKSITINYPYTSKFVEVSKSDRRVLNVKNDAVRDLIAEVKALAYHEIGHIRFTIPFIDLVTQTAEDTLRGREWPQNAQFCWNVLEDQRMESAVVADSPTIGTYLTVLISERFDAEQPTLWMLLAGRSYLPEAVRQAAYNLFGAAYGFDEADNVQTIVDAYCAATTVQELRLQVLALSDLYARIDERPLAYQGSHSSQRTRGDKGPKPEQGATDPQEPVKGDDASDDDAGDDDAGDGSESQGDDGAEAQGQDGDSDDTDTDTDEYGNGQGAGTSDDSQDDSQDDSDSDQGAPTATTGSGLTKSEPTTPEEASNALQQAIEDLLKDHAEDLLNDSQLDSLMEQFTERANDYANDDLPRYVDYNDLPTDVLIDAEGIAAQMERSFDVRTADCAPIWQFRTTRGIVDPFAYKTREPGNREFYRQFDQTGDLGRSVAVSVLLDSSGSMGGYGDQLGAAAYAITTACRSLDIPTTVMTFNDNARLLYGPDDLDVVPTTIRITGGTSPGGALIAAVDQRYDKREHLVIILTDGLWDKCDIEEMRTLAITDAKVFVVGFNLGYWALEPFAKGGATETRIIKALSELPEFVESVVSQYLG